QVRPALIHELPQLSQLAADYRSGASSPVQVTQELLNRIDETNPLLNAFISVWHERALQAAAHAERELGSGIDRGPLHGVPIALKENITVAGERATYGSRAVPRHNQDADAWITHALLENGAVIIGKTNLLEYAYGIVHPAFGQTNNPW